MILFEAHFLHQMALKKLASIVKSIDNRKIALTLQVHRGSIDGDKACF
jgi:hypothetical protein